MRGRLGRYNVKRGGGDVKGGGYNLKCGARSAPPENFKPDFIFYLSGVDVLNNDKLGRLGLSIDGCKERDKFILELCKKNSIPVQISMGGGYSELLKNIIEAHSNTFRLAQEIYF